VHANQAHGEGPRLFSEGDRAVMQAKYTF